MPDILPFLKSLISVSGLSGEEAPVADLIAGRWNSLVDEVRLSRVGSLHGLKRGSGKRPPPAVMIAAHMDGIGMRVSKIVVVLHITKIGAIDLRVLPGAEVIVHAAGSNQKLPAVVLLPPRRFLPESAGDGFPGIEHFLVDTGLLPREVKRQIHVGDLVSFADGPFELAGGVIAGHTVDNRASIAALTICLEELQKKPHVWDVWAVATVQEEVSYLGAYSSAFELRPQIAIILDTTFAKGPGADGWQTFPMGKGVGLCIGPNMHPFLHKKLKELADGSKFLVFM
jgi:endoglucanase